MKKMLKRAAAVFAAVTTVMSISGCKGLIPEKNDTAQSGTISYWMAMPAAAKLSYQNFADTPLGKKWLEETGIDINFVHPENDEQFNLMLASSNLSDIIEYDWCTQFPGGPQKAIDQNQIITFDEDMLKKNAPNFYKIVSEDNEIKKLCTTSKGEFYMFPFIRGDESLLISTGPIVRKDWLDELGMAMPETMDDWYNMLKAFKEKKGASTPLILNGIKAAINNGMFSGAYNAPNTFFIDNGKVKYGPYQDTYKDLLVELNKWYKEGLLDNNFMGIDSKIVDSSMTNGQAGATIGALGGGIGKWTAAATEEGYELAGAPFPVVNRGEKSMFSARQNVVPGFGAAISTHCKDVEAAMKFLDYAYSDEGHMLMNFGIEGESYKMENGYPKYTELVTKNPDGESMANVLSRYVRASGIGAFVQDKRYIEQYSSLPEQQAAIKTWSDTDTEKHLMPPITPSSDLSAEFSKIINECTTFIDEYTLKFITGSISFDEWDNYIAQLKAFNIDRAIEIYQQTYDEYQGK